MRPELLNPLFAPVTSLKGVGPRIGKLIEKLAGDKVVDLCWHLPSGLTDRRFRPKVAEAPDNVIATMTVTVDEHHPSPNRRVPYRILCSDETGTLTLVFFNAREEYLRELLPEGSQRIISGRVAIYQDAPQIAHPDYVLGLDKADEMPLIEPQYSLTAGLTSKPLLKSESKEVYQRRTRYIDGIRMQGTSYRITVLFYMAFPKGRVSMLFWWFPLF